MYSLCQSQWYTSKSLSLVCAYFLISQSFFSYGECFMGNAFRLNWNDNQTINKSYWKRSNHDTVASDISKAGEMIIQPQLNMLNWRLIQTVSAQFICVWLLGDQFLLCFPSSRHAPRDSNKRRVRQEAQAALVLPRRQEFSWLHQNVWTQDLFVSNLTQGFRSGRSPPLGCWRGTEEWAPLLFEWLVCSSAGSDTGAWRSTWIDFGQDISQTFVRLFLRLGEKSKACSMSQRGDGFLLNPWARAPLLTASWISS